METSILEGFQVELEKATGQVAAQVMLFCEDAKSSKQIQALLGLKHRETFLNNYLKPLLNSGWIERTIPDKPRSSKQKYRLTDAGKRFLEKCSKEGTANGR